MRKALLVAPLYSIAVAGCAPGPSPVPPVMATRPVVPDSSTRAALQGRWQVLLRLGNSRRAATVGTIEFGGVHHATWAERGLVGRRQLSLDPFVPRTMPRTQPSPLQDDYIVLVRQRGPWLEIWLTPGMADYGFRLHGEWKNGALQGTVCEDQYSHECRTCGTFTMTRAGESDAELALGVGGWRSGS